jgi:hypothetical protein
MIVLLAVEGARRSIEIQDDKLMCSARLGRKGGDKGMQVAGSQAWGAPNEEVQARTEPHCPPLPATQGPRPVEEGGRAHEEP